MDCLMVVLAGMVGVVTSHTLEPGSCKSVRNVQDFQPMQFEGKWYVMEISSTSSQCLTMNFTRTEAGFAVEEARELFLLSKIGVDHIATNRGFFSIHDPNNPSRMLASWNLNILGVAEVTVVDTDYTQFAVLHECQSLFLLRRVSVVILSRQTTLDEAVLQKVKDDLQDLGINLSKLDKINHDNCKRPDQVDFNLDEGILTGAVGGGDSGQPAENPPIVGVPEETTVSNRENEILNAKR